MRAKATSSVLMVAMMAIVGVSLAGCDDAEQGRVLSYEKGTYRGEKDTEISPETQNELRARATMQGGM